MESTNHVFSVVDEGGFVTVATRWMGQYYELTNTSPQKNIQKAALINDMKSQLAAVVEIDG